jgi:hypothetical protein
MIDQIDPDVSAGGLATILSGKLDIATTAIGIALIGLDIAEVPAAPLAAVKGRWR